MSMSKIFLDLKIEPLPRNTVPQLTLDTFIQAVSLKINTDERFKRLFPADGTELVWKPRSLDASRGFIDTAAVANVSAALSAAEKVVLLDLMLGTIHVLCKHISRNYIVEEARNLGMIWNRLRVYYGFRKTGARPLGLIKHHLKPDQSYEDLWEQLLAHGQDCLLDPTNTIKHLNEKPTTKESMQPAYMNCLVVLWLHSIDHKLVDLVGHRFSKELTDHDLYSIREEISESIPALLYTSSGEDSALTMRQITQRQYHPQPPSIYHRQPMPNDNPYKTSSSNPGAANKKTCSICLKAGIPHNHFTSSCQFLTRSDRQFFARSRLVCGEEEAPDTTPDPATINRIEMEPSPVLAAQYQQLQVSITLDSGAESNLVSYQEALRLGIEIIPASQGALQADGTTKLHVRGECHITMHVSHHSLQFHGLVVDNLGTPVVGGVPFHTCNNIVTNLPNRSISIQNCCCVRYDSSDRPRPLTSIIRITKRLTLLPGEALTIPVPPFFSSSETIAIEPRLQARSFAEYGPWLTPEIQVISPTSSITLHNTSQEPVRLGAHEQIANIRRTEPAPSNADYSNTHQLELRGSAIRNPTIDVRSSPHTIQLDPNQQLDRQWKQRFLHLHDQYKEVFRPGLGRYNGASGQHLMKINMGKTEPPAYKGRCPVYAHTDKALLQAKFDQLLEAGVFARPDDLDITVEHVSPSFLIKKITKGESKAESLGPLETSRLVTNFGGLAEHTKVQPCLITNSDEALNQIGQWDYLIQSDFSQSYYQMEVHPDSLKYLGVVTPFKGTYIYQRCAMGMPGSEVCQEELLCKILGQLMLQGKVVKVADDIFCGGKTLDELFDTWSDVLQAIHLNGLHLSPKKTIICPSATTVLGWKWQNGSLSATSHKLSALQTCDQPKTVYAMRGFLGAYKFLSRVIPESRPLLDPLEASTKGKNSKDLIMWTDGLSHAFHEAQRHLSNTKSITIPRSSDELQIITDASLNQRGLAATLFAIRDGTPHLAGFFNAKTKPHQQRWLPCEVEALCISSAVNFFSPKIARSLHRCVVFTDSRPCVQAHNKMCRGAFSASAKVMTYLSSLCKYGIRVKHISGKQNLTSDFTSRNPVDCPDQSCQVCKFVNQSEEAVIGNVTTQDLVHSNPPLFTSRQAWKDIQLSDPDLRRVHNLIKEGKNPPKKGKHLRDTKRYCNELTIARDGLLVRRPINEQFQAATEKIVIPRSITHGIVTAVHLKLNHPSKKQLTENLTRSFYALNLRETIDAVVDRCHVCISMRTVPSTFIEQSTTPPPNKIGLEYSADVIRRNRQCMLLLRENTSSFTTTALVDNETADSLRESLIYLSSQLRNQIGPKITIRVDPAPAFRNLSTDKILANLGITLQVGDEKNPNKNSIAERAIRELHSEIVKLHPDGGQVSKSSLAIATSNLNNLIRSSHFSSREIWTHRDQYSATQIPIDDQDIINYKFAQRIASHPASAKYKSRGKTAPIYPAVYVGSLVYIASERDKTKLRDKYIVTEIQHPHCFVRKFTGRQLRARRYRVNLADTLPIEPSASPELQPQTYEHYDDDDDDENIVVEDTDEQHPRNLNQNVNNVIIDQNVDSDNDDIIQNRDPNNGENARVDNAENARLNNGENAILDYNVNVPQPRLRNRATMRQPTRLDDFDLDYTSSDSE